MKRGAILFLFFGAILFSPLASAAIDIEADSLLLKVSVKEGDSIFKSVSFSTNSGGEFSVREEGLQGVSFDEELFSLGSNEVKSVGVSFDSLGLEPGVYAGYIVISDSLGNSKDLPVVLEIESEDVFFDINLDVPPQYSSISPGGKLVAQLRVFDLTGFRLEDALGPSDVELEYVVKGIDGSLLSREVESVVVDGQARVSKTVFIPEDVADGDYLFFVTAKYKSSLGTSSYFFSVVDAPDEALSFAGLDFRFISVLIVIVLFFLGIIFLFVYLIHERDKMFLELKKYNSLELMRQRELLSSQKRYVKGGRSNAEIEREVQQKVNNLKKKQEKRVAKLKELRKKGKRNDMQKMISKWKKEGYNSVALNSKLSGVSSKDMKKQMDKWKKEGYGKTKK